MKTETKKREKIERLIKEVRSSIIYETVKFDPDREYIQELIEIVKSLQNDLDNEK